MTRRALFSLLAVLAAACSEAPKKISVGLRFDASACRTCFSPDECPLDCGGQISIKVIDLDNQVLESACLPWDYEMGKRLRDLPALLATAELDATRVPAGTQVAFEVAVWNYATFEACPRIVVDFPGDLPHSEFLEYPWYFGRSPVYTVSSGLTSVEVPLGCVTGDDFCAVQPNLTQFDAHVTEVHTLLDPPIDPTTLEVRTGNVFPFVAGDPEAPLHAEFNFYQSWQLDLVGGDPFLDAYWQTIRSEPFNFDEFCVGTIVTRIGAGGTVSTVSCEGFFDGVVVDARGYFVDKKRVDQIVTALALPSFPDGGLLIGRVVDAAGQPAADVFIRPPEDDTANIVYLDEIDDPDNPGQTRLIRKSAGPTAANGFFVVDDAALTPDQWVMPPNTARCCDTFEAWKTDGSMGFSPGPVGLVDGVVMSTVIQLSP